MNDELVKRGLEIRGDVLGAEHVDRALAHAEIEDTLTQLVVYGGVSAGIEALRVGREVLAEAGDASS